MCPKVGDLNHHLALFVANWSKSEFPTYFQLRCGCIFLEQSQILSGIQFTRYFIKLVLAKPSAFSSCRHAHALTACFQCQDHDRDESFRFHKNQPDEMSCKLDITENLGSFKKYTTTPEGTTSSLAGGVTSQEGKKYETLTKYFFDKSIWIWSKKSACLVHNHPIHTVI